jgi:dinuclear metal center YbgI/SA1388 family protein
MKAIDIINKIENICPENLAYSWDNVGLLCGDKNKEIKTVLLTLDTNLNVVKEAVETGADMIVSHHPILLGGIKRIDYSTPTGKMLKLLIENNIVLFAAHTNMDTANGGINDALAELFELSDVKILEQHTDNTEAGLGRYGKLSKSVTLSELAKITKNKLKTPCVRVSGDLNANISTLAVASGSCSEIIPLAKSLGCDAIITGDMKYHNSIDSVESGICVIDAGHYPTELIVMDIFESILKDSDLKLIKSKNKDIFQFI